MKLLKWLKKLIPQKGAKEIPPEEGLKNRKKMEARIEASIKKGK